MTPPPQIWQELAADVFNYDTDWLEVIDNRSPATTTFTDTEQTTTITGCFPANKIRSAMRYFLGYSYADNTAPYKLHRELPARHPRFPGLYAYSATATELSPQAVNEGTPNAPRYTPPMLLSPFSSTKDEFMYYASYEKLYLTVNYKSFGRMKFLPDSDIDNYAEEVDRYTLITTDSSVEALSADGVSQLLFKEGPPGPPAGLNNLGTPFPAPIAELMGKTAISIKWFKVPHNYLSSNPNVLLLDKILGKFVAGNTPANYNTWAYPPRIGTVNRDTFLGFLPGTLLLRAVKVEEILYPVTPADPYQPIGGYNLTFVWEHFDPVKGVAYDPVTSPYRGHRVFPWRKDGLWYYAQRETSSVSTSYLGKEMLPLTTHANVFQNVNDPTP